MEASLFKAGWRSEQNIKRLMRVEALYTDVELNSPARD
ncbi:hypothetical protein OCC_14460 [Thermococcus litoralis DSM 5473]|uniref:Uncharacterized protein n=1 Tax=Thermococcus litoralis (strain ATCC 51850 / DSM 5473 / JCM 8560 / NS-C) TaxID=523849 RepID=S5ZBD5_THELN|nr:hypothetical protein OCC_14460 [Thermococcus litoralis DSM 5473]